MKLLGSRFAAEVEASRALMGRAQALLATIRNHPGHPDQKSHGRKGRGGSGVRQALANASTTEELNAAVADEARRISGRGVEVNLAGSDLQIAREHAEGVLQGLERLPGADLAYVGTYGPDSKSGSIGRNLDAEHGEAFAVTVGSAVYFNNRHGASPDEYRASLTLSNSDGHMVARDPRGVALHEFGHVVSHRGAAGFAGESVAETSAKAAGATLRDHVTSNISRYAATSAGELGAEAFADVALNGSGASRLSREIADIEAKAAGL